MVFRIVHACIFEARHVAQLRGSLFSQELHVVFGAEMQASRSDKL